MGVINLEGVTSGLGMILVLVDGGGLLGEPGQTAALETPSRQRVILDYHFILFYLNV